MLKLLQSFSIKPPIFLYWYIYISFDANIQYLISQIYTAAVVNDARKASEDEQMQRVTAAVQHRQQSTLQHPVKNQPVQQHHTLQLNHKQHRSSAFNIDNLVSPASSHDKAFINNFNTLSHNFNNNFNNCLHSCYDNKTTHMNINNSTSNNSNLMHVLNPTDIKKIQETPI